MEQTKWKPVSPINCAMVSGNFLIFGYSGDTNDPHRSYLCSLNKSGEFETALGLKFELNDYLYNTFKCIGGRNLVGVKGETLNNLQVVRFSGEWEIES